MNKDKYIWIFGENLSNTHNNNSFYFWKEIVNNNDDIDKYFILTKTKENIKFIKILSKYERKYIIWRNSIKHFMTYFAADMYFVTLSYRDIQPEEYKGRKFKFKIKKPVIYLQHGTLAMKKIDYTYNSYNNNMFRFLYYNKNIKEDLIEKNKFKEYQLYYGEYQPRYKELLLKSDKYIHYKDKQKEFLWFLTWREYFGENIPTKVFLRKVKNIVKNEDLTRYLEKNKIKLNIVLHTFFKMEEINQLIEETKENENIIFSYQSDIDVMEKIASSDLLITDYSSVGFDFSFLKKPVVLFQPDLNIYLNKRKMYCTKEEIEKNSIKEENELIDTIINEKYKTNKFFMSRLPDNIDYDYIRNGKHIQKMYSYFYKLQKNKITFLGYNFFGIGGTVTATMALAESLLEKGYLVELISLKKIKRLSMFPAALTVNGLYSKNSRKDKLLMRFMKNKKKFGYLRYDPNVELLKPIVGYRLNNLMKNIKSKTVISTRESMHLILKNATSSHIKEKIYFYHCDAEAIENNFPKLMDEIRKEKLEKVVFVTEKNKSKYKKIFKYENYCKDLVLGNTIQSCKMINREEIEVMKPIFVEELNRECVTDESKLRVQNKKYKGAYLLRINSDRKGDVDNLIEFGKYLRDNNIKNIVVNVYGKGNYVKEFIDIIVNERLEEIICYRGYTNNIKNTLKVNDCLLDFSLINSFGMTYVEAILNGKPVFCMKNTGSLEVLKELPEVYIESFEDLVKKVYNIPNITIEKLKENYNKIYQKYSRDTVSKKFIKFMEE